MLREDKRDMSRRSNDNHQAGRARVFISYKRTDPDETLALQLHDALGQHYDVFIDRQILTGAHWARRINEEIERADFFVVLLSKLSVHSEMVLGEIDKARGLAADRENRRPRLLPVRVAFQDRLPFPLNAWFQFVNWIEWQAPRDTPLVVKNLRDSIINGAAPSGPPRGGAGLSKPAPRFEPVRPPIELQQPFGGPPPKGALSLDSAYYVERPSDARMRSLLRRNGVTISIRGPRQIGKTSLLARAVRMAEAEGKRVAWIDFQLFEKSALADARTFYQQFCGHISLALGIEPHIEQHWDDRLGNMFNCAQYIKNYVLPRAGGPLLLAMDEVDRVLESGFRTDFFRMLRSWDKRLDMVLVASTEPRMWIENTYESPFNVAEQVDLGDFTADDVRNLNRRYGSPLRADQLQRLIDLVGGHPYLVHYAIYSVASRIYSPEQLFARSVSDDSPFGDHLNHLLFRLYDKPDLADTMRRIIANRGCRDERMFYQLNGAGLVRRKGEHVRPSRQLYADFLRSRLQPRPVWPFGALFFS
jgi:hypothetical protein